MTRSASGLLFAALLAAVIAWVAPTLTSELGPATPLQSHYVASVQQLAGDGPRALRERWQDWVAERGSRDEPSPLRIAPVAAGAAWSAAFGATPRSLAWLALSAHLALVVLQFAFARRAWGDAFAAGVAALTAFAPLSLGTARLALGDSVAVAWQVASVWLFLEVLRDPASRGWRAAFAACLALALLSSEASLALVPSFALVAVFARGPARARTLAMVALAKLAWAVCAFAVAGDWSSFSRGVRLSTWSPPKTVYVFHFASGPWFRCIADALLISPWPTLLGIGGLAVVAAQARSQRVDPDRARLAALVVLLVLALSVLAKGARTALFADALLRVLALALLVELVGQRPAPRARVALVALVVLLCVVDALDFRRNFAAPDVEDPVTSELVSARGIVPRGAAADE